MVLTGDSSNILSPVLTRIKQAVRIPCQFPVIGGDLKDLASYLVQRVLQVCAIVLLREKNYSKLWHMFGVNFRHGSYQTKDELVDLVQLSIKTKAQALLAA
jgi:hypothetical protein